MSGSHLVKLRTIDHEELYELVITDRAKNECTVIRLSDDQLALLAWEFADAVMHRHYWMKRLGREPAPHSEPRQHQQAAE